ncbi:hypothetical protein [Actinocorallia populi]|uniref:hypothetical protein n=1 Tax=Actinocorallia populi TaxID=2079200 RepID=UPI001300BBE3|nr:hypothetical protein [Actinocorallia populi]
MGDYEKVVQAVKAAQMAVGMWSDRVRQSGERRHGLGPTDPLWEVDADYRASLDAAAALSDALEVIEGMAGVADRTEKEHAAAEARERARAGSENRQQVHQAAVLNELAEAGFEHQDAEFRLEATAERVRRAVQAACAEGVSAQRAAQIGGVPLEAVNRWACRDENTQMAAMRKDQ